MMTEGRYLKVTEWNHLSPGVSRKLTEMSLSASQEVRSSQEDVLLQTAAMTIQRAWRRHVHTEVFRYFKVLVGRCDRRDPQAILKAVNPREVELLDAAAGVFVRFRLGGFTFPPSIYYKIFTRRPIADVCAGSPKDYTQPGLKRPVARQTNNGWPLVQVDRSGWYQRTENNSWRVFCSKLVPSGEPREVGADKKMDFHHSKLQRQQDVDKWRKKRKIEWLKQMYNQGRLQARPAQQHVATLTPTAAQEVRDSAAEKGDDELPDWELDELLIWTNSLNFEEYMEEWKRLACSHSSATGKACSSSFIPFGPVSWPPPRVADVHTHLAGLDPQCAGVAGEHSLVKKRFKKFPMKASQCC